MPGSRSMRPGQLAELNAAPRLAYGTRFGRAYHTTVESFLDSRIGSSYRHKVDLILTSPPFPLNRKKSYGNLTGDRYLEWLEELAPGLLTLLKPRGSIVIEIGNAWEGGSPIMSTLTTRSLLAFLDAGNLNLCEEFVGFNRASLPLPAEWVNVRRIRVKDAFTHIWWMSPTQRPVANNRRVLAPYKPAMLQLLKTGKYNAGRRPSGNVVGETSFSHNNGGAIPPNVLEYSNTAASDAYLAFCKSRGLQPHPARMNGSVARFFIKFLTTEGGLVLDPFAGSNTTGGEAQALKRRWVSLERDADYLYGSSGRFH
jgi:DNA modification methylase